MNNEEQKEFEELVARYGLYGSVNPTRNFIDKILNQRKEKLIEKIENSIEILADIEHTRWSNWQKHLHSKCVGLFTDKGVPMVGFQLEDFHRWEKQINTPYAELSEPEKESDRREVRNTLKALRDFLSQNTRE